MRRFRASTVKPLVRHQGARGPGAGAGPRLLCIALLFAIAIPKSSTSPGRVTSTGVPIHSDQPIATNYKKENPINCQVSPWTPWLPCSMSCGGGERRRQRSVVTPRVADGRECPELDHQERCPTQQCPVDCEQDEWLPWTPCSLTCGVNLGSSQRRRNQIAKAAFGGAPCTGVWV